MSEISLTEQPHLQQIDLTTLDLNQLSQLKLQLDEEITLLQDSLQKLKIAQIKFLESADCFDKFTPDAKGKEILVPLTCSMYVPGKLIDTEKVLVDIGTGYFVEKCVADAKDYFKRRVLNVTDKMKKIQMLAQEKSRIREATIDVMEMKIQALQGQQGAAAQA